MEGVNVIIVDAAEYNAATNRISNALDLLRDEMKSLRHQDVTLMRQFINMNDKIQCISKEQRSQKIKNKRERNRTRCISTIKSSTTPSSTWPTISRRCDVIPEMRERRGSTSSDDESQDESLSGSMTSLSDDMSDSTSSSITSSIPVFQSPVLSRHRSNSATTTNKAYDRKEAVLSKNMNLLTISQSESDDSEEERL